MQRFTVTIWHGALVMIVVHGLILALISAAERFVTSWDAPGIIPLVLIIVVEAMVTQWLIAHEHQTFEEQVKVRLLELLVIVVVVRLWSLAAQGEPLLVSITPWLREPLQFLSGRFFEYFVWVLVAWMVTAFLMSDVLDWQSGSYIAATNDSTIERDHLQQEWDESVARFRRRYVMLVFVMLAASTLAVYGGRPMPAINSTLLVVSTIAALVAGLVLQSEGRLSLLRRSWALDNIVVDAGVNRRWGRMGMVLIGVLVLLAPLLGAVMLVAPPPPIVPVLNLLLVGMTVVVSVVLLLISILLAPIIFLLSLLNSGTTPPPAPALPQFEPPQIAQVAGERPLWPALIFWGCILVLIGLAFARYLRGRSDIGAALRRWRIFRWIRLTAGEFWSDARGWAILAATTLRKMRRPRNRTKARLRAQGIQAQLRAMYRRMRGAGVRRGVVSRMAQTPYEYSAELERTLAAAGDDVRGLTEAYVAAEYGPNPEEPSHLQQARRHWRRLQRWLLRSATLRRRDPPSSGQ